MTLYDLTTEQMVINRMLEENGGELTPELEQALMITEENLSVKTEGYCKAIAIYKGEVETLKAEIDRLTAKKKTAEKVFLTSTNWTERPFGSCRMVGL